MFGLRKNVVFLVFIFSFLWDLPQKTLVCLCVLYSVFILSIQKTTYYFWAFSFSWKWISWHFHKKTNFMGPTNSKLSYQKLSHSLSLSLNDGGGQSMRVIYGWCSLVVDSFLVWWFFCELVCWKGCGGYLF